MDALVIPVLLVLELAVAVERWAHEASPTCRARAFLVSDAGILFLIALLAAAVAGGLLVIG